MPAATDTASNGRVDLKELALAAMRNFNDNILIYGTAIPMAFGDTYTVGTSHIGDVGDILRLFRFPGGAYINQLRLTATDMDTNATPTLVWDVVVTDDSDTVKATLINDTAIGQAGTSDSLDEASIGEFVGNYWLALKVAAVSATAAAGTVKVYCQFHVGLMNTTGTGTMSSLNPRVTDAGV